MAKTENLTILFTDIVGYTKLTSALSREALRELLHGHDRILMPLCRAFGGRRVKSIGDALLLAFHSPTDAVRCGMAMQNAIARARRDEPALAQLHVRVAINAGEVRTERGDVFGEAVNVAARLEDLTPPDAIWFTEAVYLAMNKAEAPSAPLGERELRGMPEPVRVYCVPSAPAGAESPFPPVAVPRHPVRNAMDAVARQAAATHARLAPALRAAARGAAHLSHPVRWLVVTAACIAIVLSLTLYVPAEPVDASLQEASATGTAGSDLRREGDALLAQGDLKTLSALIEAELQQRPGSAEGALLKGHLAFARKNRLQGLAEYSRALALEPKLQEDSRLARNLAGLVDSDPAALRPLALQYPSEALLKALSRRSGQAGFAGRFQAAQLLRDLGQGKRIDRFNYAVQELEGRSDCDDRLAAVRQLRALKDPRAIPHLQKAIDGGVGQWFKQLCLRDEATATIEELKNARARS